MATDTAPLEFTCPRCKAEVRERFYGPCTSCLDGLRSSMGSAARDVDVADYEPKMNVVPNQVALKD